MWAHRPWVGNFLPRSTPSGGELAEYAQRLTAVEGNTTFYALPKPETIRRWADSVPDDFRFCFKVPRTISHEKRLVAAEAELAEFVELTEPLHHKMGPISIQLPASFGPEGFGALESFASALPGSLEWAVEVRHPEFFVGGRHEGTLDDLLRTHGVNRVIFDTRRFFEGPVTTPEEVEASQRKPRLPVRPTATASSPVVRFIDQNDPTRNSHQLGQWKAKLHSWLEDGLSPYFFAHTPDNLRSPELARWVYEDATGDRLPEPGPGSLF